MLLFDINNEVTYDAYPDCSWWNENRECWVVDGPICKVYFFPGEKFNYFDEQVEVWCPED